MAAPHRLLLYTKPAIPGRVKTRLVGELTPAQAAELHGAFVADLLERLAGQDFELWVAWALEANEEPPPLQVGRPVPVLRQEGAGLGERLYRGLARAARESGGARAVAALGSDHPTVPLATLREAFARVDGGADVVLGPSLDGGYYLIALAPGAVRPELFERIDWSTERVLAQTLERAREAGLEVSLLEEASDVDTPEDLRRLAALLRAGADAPASPAASPCPRTRDLLAAWGRLEPRPVEAR